MLTSMALNETDHLKYLGMAEKILENRVEWTGIGVKAYYIIIACTGLVKKMKGSSLNEEAFAAEKVTILMQQMLSRFRDSASLSMTQSLTNGVSPCPSDVLTQITDTLPQVSFHYF